jgi:hypothetical protein
MLISDTAVAIASRLLNLGVQTGSNKATIRVLRQAALLLAPKENCLTPVHAMLLQACISAKMYTFAADFIRQNEIYHVEPKKTALTVQSFLEYFYYSGIW